MVVNQLFIHKPPNELLNNVIKAFGLTDINDTREFSQLDIEKNNTIKNIHNLEKEISQCYIPCKRKNYIDNIKNITHKEIITIFRQILKTHNYDLYSREKFIKGTKYLVYKIITKNDKLIISKTKKKNAKKRICYSF